MSSPNPPKAVHKPSEQSFLEESLESGGSTARETESAADQPNPGEVTAKIDVLREELVRHRQDFMRRGIESAQRAWPVGVFALNRTQILRNTRRTADLDYLRRFLQGVCQIYEGCFQSFGTQMSSQVLKEIWLDGIEPRWTMCVRSLGADLERLYHDDKPQAAAERVRALEAEAARIHDHELGLWRVKIEEAATHGRLVRRKLVTDRPNSVETEGSQAHRPESPPKRAQKQKDLSEYLDDAKLTKAQRECASLRWEYGMKVLDIARQLGKHHSTIQYHLNRAKQKMDTKIKAKGRVAPLPPME